MELTLKDILAATHGSLVQGDGNTVVTRISTDTRKITPDDFYVALVGPRFNGHDFLADAVQKGARGAVVSQDVLPSLPKNFSLIRVADTQKALGDIANTWRKRFSIPVIAVTGSCGKTTTKDMLAYCLEERGEVCKTQGNLNNLIGLPLTVFTLTKKHQFAVWEMGMNAFGEIARMTEIAEPTLGLITNVGLAHLEGLGNQEGIAKAKGELFEGLGAKAVAVVNADDPFILNMKTKAQRLTYGKAEEVQIRCEHVKYGEGTMEVTVRDPKRTTVFKLNVLGDHYVSDWLGCYAVLYHLGLTPEEAQRGILKFEPQSMRGGMVKLPNEVMVINDSYNANPDAMEAALAAFEKRFPQSRRIAVLGEMFELGPEAEKLHWQTGKIAAELGAEALYAFGNFSQAMVDGFRAAKPGHEGVAYTDMDRLCQDLKKSIRQGDAVLVKGSRGSRMERVVDYLKGSVPAV